MINTKLIQSNSFDNNFSPNISTFKQIQTVLTNLQEKYKKDFLFFLVKPIDQIILNLNSSQISIQYKNTISYSEKYQYLKRYYQNITAFGRKQISQRIKILTDFYQSNKMLSYQYPTMVVTSTQQIFQKRYKRIKKLDSESRSDSSVSKQISSIFSNQVHQDNIQYLKQLNNLSFQQISHSQSSPRKKQVEYSFTVHDIYQDGRSNRKFQFQKIFSDIIPLEKQVNHLICDFNDLDEENIMKNYLEIQQKQVLKNVHKNQYMTTYTPNPKQIQKILNKANSSATIVSKNNQLNSPRLNGNQSNYYQYKYIPMQNLTQQRKSEKKQLVQKNQENKIEQNKITFKKQSQFEKYKINKIKLDNNKWLELNYLKEQNEIKINNNNHNNNNNNHSNNTINSNNNINSNNMNNYSNNNNSNTYNHKQENQYRPNSNNNQIYQQNYQRYYPDKNQKEFKSRNSYQVSNIRDLQELRSIRQQLRQKNKIGGFNYNHVFEKNKTQIDQQNNQHIYHKYNKQTFRHSQEYIQLPTSPRGVVKKTHVILGPQEQEMILTHRRSPTQYPPKSIRELPPTTKKFIELKYESSKKISYPPVATLQNARSSQNLLRSLNRFQY